MVTVRYSIGWKAMGPLDGVRGIGYCSLNFVRPRNKEFYLDELVGEFEVLGLDREDEVKRQRVINEADALRANEAVNGHFQHEVVASRCKIKDDVLQVVILAELVEYRMVKDIFEATLSPSVVTSCLKKTVEMDGGVADVINRNKYIDSLMKSTETAADAILLRTKVSIQLSKGGFHLTKLQYQ
ncbi:hypothetical protein ACROYT_G010963 [Oculina patagonica]